MAIRKPLVQIDGQVQELPASDSLTVANTNVASQSVTIPVNTSTVVVGTYTVDNTVTVDGSLGVI